MKNAAEIVSIKRESVRSSVDKDCVLIVDAIRRLREGTWELSDEDGDWANFLLPRIKGAISDHIEYEKICILPNLPVELKKEHTEDHDKIASLFWALEESKVQKKFLQFRSLLALLSAMIEGHHKEFGCHLPTFKDCGDDCVKELVIKRSKGFCLEYK